MKDLQFIELGYKPKNDLVCLFKIKPNKISIKKAANTVALESSVGTWTEVKAQDYVKQLRAKVFSIKGNWIKIAYPQELFEYDNVPNILSSIAGNIMGMKAVIMAGGEGTRLRPITLTTPKPLVPVAGKACIDYVIESLCLAGITEIIITSGFRAGQLLAHTGAY